MTMATVMSAIEALATLSARVDRLMKGHDA